MDKNAERSTETGEKTKTEAKAALLVRLIFGGLIVALIAVMAAISIYGEKQQGGTQAPVDAADH